MATKNYPHLLDRIVTADMSPKCKIVLMSMISFTRRGENICEFSKPEIANRACITRPTADSATTEFVKMGLIRKEGRGRQTIWVVEEEKVLALPRKPTLKQAKALPERILPERDFTEPGKIFTGDPVNSLPDTGKVFTGETPQVPDSKDEFAPLVSNTVSESVGSAVSPPFNPPQGGYRRWSRPKSEGEQTQESQVLNWKGQQETTPKSAPIEAPQYERRSTPQQPNQDPPAFTLTPPPSVEPKLTGLRNTEIRTPPGVAVGAACVEAKTRENEAVARVYEHWVRAIEGKPGMLRQTEARKRRESLIRYYLEQSEFDADDLTAAIDGCVGDTWWADRGKTDIERHILESEARIREFIVKGKRKAVAAPRPTEYRNKEATPELIEYWGRLVLTPSKTKCTVESMCRTLNISQEVAVSAIERVKAKYNGDAAIVSSGWGRPEA